MSGRGNCYNNAVVETFFKTLKSELVWRTVFQSRAEANDAIGHYIDGPAIPYGAIRPSTSSAPFSSKGSPGSCQTAFPKLKQVHLACKPSTTHSGDHGVCERRIHKRYLSKAKTALAF
jgi:transposase InsO family protein